MKMYCTICMRISQWFKAFCEFESETLWECSACGNHKENVRATA